MCPSALHPNRGSHGVAAVGEFTAFFYPDFYMKCSPESYDGKSTDRAKGLSNQHVAGVRDPKQVRARCSDAATSAMHLVVSALLLLSFAPYLSPPFSLSLSVPRPDLRGSTPRVAEQAEPGPVDLGPGPAPGISRRTRLRRERLARHDAPPDDEEQARPAAQGRRGARRARAPAWSLLGTCACACMYTCTTAAVAVVVATTAVGNSLWRTRGRGGGRGGGG